MTQRPPRNAPLWPGESVREQQRKAAVRQQILRRAAEQGLAQAAAPESAHDDQPGAQRHGLFLQPFLDRVGAALDDQQFGMDAVARQITQGVGNNDQCWEDCGKNGVRCTKSKISSDKKTPPKRGLSVGEIMPSCDD